MQPVLLSNHTLHHMGGEQQQHSKACTDRALRRRGGRARSLRRAVTGQAAAHFVWATWHEQATWRRVYPSVTST